MSYTCSKHEGFDPENCPDCKAQLDYHLKKAAIGTQSPSPTGPSAQTGAHVITHNSIAYKKIIDYTDTELDFAINDAVEHCRMPARLQINVREAHSSLDFWRILRGVDAYMEKRKRKEAKGFTPGVDFTKAAKR